MNPSDPSTLSKKDKKKAAFHPMVVLQPGERIICEIKRHPFGIIGVYAAALVALVIAGSLAITAPTYIDEYSFDGNLNTFVAVGVVLFMILMGLILVVATIVYWQNRWIVTDDSVTQISQDSLFGRRVSQLSMENLEDVTVDQHGILPTLFNYGTLKAETAGEHSKFTFPYCPQPNKYARLILEVHETFLHQRRHQPQAVNPVNPISGPHFEGAPVQPQPQYQQNPQQMQPQQQYNQSQGQQQQAQAQPQQWQPGYQQPGTAQQQPNNASQPQQSAPQYQQYAQQPQPPQQYQQPSQDAGQQPPRPNLPPPLQ